MKKSILALMLVVSLTACATADQNVTTNASVEKTILYYKKYKSDKYGTECKTPKHIEPASSWSESFSRFNQMIGKRHTYPKKPSMFSEDLSVLAQDDVKLVCLYTNFDSDECILYRRNNTKKSKICFFDYKKYLPKGHKIYSEQDFINLVKKHDSLIAKNNCDYSRSYELTSQERIDKRNACEQKIAKTLSYYANGGFAKDRYTAEQNKKIAAAKAQKIAAEKKAIETEINNIHQQGL